MRHFLLLFTLVLVLMGRNFRCIGCGSDKFTTDRGLARHRDSCGPFRRLQAQKVKNLTLPPKENISVASTSNVNILDDSGAVELADLGLDIILEAEPDPIPPPPPQEYRPSGLPKRQTRLPKRFEDVLPAPPPLVIAPEIEVHDPILEQTPDDDIPPATQHKTDPNSYGIYRVYKSGPPSFTPDDNFRLNSTADSPNFTRSGPSSTASWGSPLGIDPTDPESLISVTKHPFANTSICRLMSWFYSGVTKTLKDLNTLVHNVLLAPDFKLDDLAGFDASKEAKKLDDFRHQNSKEREVPLNDGWIKTSVSISLPCPKESFPSEADAPKYEVEGLYYRRPLDVIKAALEERAAEDFHIAPYEEYWQPRPNAPHERIFSELYNTDAYIQEHEKIRSQPRNGCQLETVIAAIMVWSDSTHLTSFGNASLWPIYLYLGNQSKYARAKPSAFAAHHLAYIPKVSFSSVYFLQLIYQKQLDDGIQDAYQEIYGKPAPPEVLTHLRRELMHAIWLLLLDDEFMDAYVNGIMIEFPDGVLRRVFPRFFIYSADYPEKYVSLLICLVF